ncbi:hypothetical protein KSC_048020 [Ktedonobacter sp. SOSP1-52]|nr:hypothetical protein KSC_048020 [Ktedonobacter sp. SOSP1-52]
MFLRSMTFTDANGGKVFISKDEILCGVEIIQRYRETKRAPEILELSVTLDSEVKTLIVQKNDIESMRKEPTHL